MLREQIAAARLGIVRARSGRIFQRGELVRARDLEHGEALRVGEHVKDEHLEFHPVRLARLDRGAVGDRHVRDLLARDVEREVVLEPRDGSQEGGRVKVVRDVARPKGELGPVGGVARLGLRRADLRVFHDAVFAAAARDDADGFGRVRFGDDFGGAVGLLGDAVPDKDRVGDADETVVDAVGVHVEDLA